MKQYITSVTKRGQVTLPAEVRRLLGTKPKDKVTFLVDGKQICLGPVAFTLESAYGSVRPSQRPEDFAEVARLAKADKVERAVRKLRRVG